MNRTDASTQGHRTRRSPWLWSAALLLVAAATTAGSTYLHWLPCHGSMLEGTAFDRDPSSLVFSDACLRRMDAGLPFPSAPELAERTPWASELAAVAMGCAGMAWLPLLLGLGWQRPSRYAASAPVVVSLVLAVQCWISVRAVNHSPATALSGWWLLSIELAAVAAAIYVDMEETLPGGQLGCLTLLVWGSSAFGLVHLLVDYMVMSGLSAADWDGPPGGGYGTALTLTAAGLGIAALTLGSVGRSSPAPLPVPA